MSPPTPFDPDWLRQSSEMIVQAGRMGQSLTLRGQGSKDFYGGLPADHHPVLTTLPHTGIVDYDPAELVVVARSGTPIQELESVLAKSQQMLAFEPPRFGGRGTVGGMIASGLSGPRRVSAGAAKDFVLGMTVLDAQAQALRFGGTVMKNVAGYDMSRLHTGAMGTLGLIVDVSLKVLPVPPVEATLIFEAAAQESITWTNTWAGQPLPIAATCWCDGRLHIRLAGASAAVRAAREKLGGELMAEPAARDFWARLRDHGHDFFAVNSAAPDHHLWRLSVPSTAPHFDAITDPQWIEWGGALRWMKTRASAAVLRAWASAQGGHATCFRAASDTIRQQGTLTPPDAALMKIHQRLKQELDHQRIFNPDRLYPGL